jgi:hypothetical protein
MKRILTFMMGLSAAVNLAGAATTAWVGPGDGPWNDPGRWSLGVPNAATHEVTIAGIGTWTVTVAAGTPATAMNLQRLVLGGSGSEAVVLRLDRLGATPMRLIDSLNIFAGGSLEVVDSRLELDGALSGGGFHLNAGSVSLDGGSWLVTNAVTRIGRVGDGRATVRSGRFDAGGDLLVGDLTGSSGLFVLQGGTAVVQGMIHIADDLGSVGEMRVEGGILQMNGPTLRIGDDGSGRMVVSDGSVLADDISVGRGPGSDGRLTVSGGTMRCGDVSIGRFEGARGRAEVVGGLLDLSLDTLSVGREGMGELLVSAGEVRAAEMVVGATNTSQGLVEITGGRLVVGHLLAERPGSVLRVASGLLEVTSSRVRNGSPLVIGDGLQSAVLRLGAGTHHFADGLVIEAGSRLEGEGDIEGQLTVRGVDARDGQGNPPTGPMLQLVRLAQAWEVRSPSQPGWVYQLEVMDDGTWAGWSDWGQPVAGTGDLIGLPIPAGFEVRMFRVRVTSN